MAALLQVRPYRPGEVVPTHPVSGLKARYCAEMLDGTLLPRWPRGANKLPSVDERWYSVTEAAALTGGSRKWLHTAIAKGQLKATRPGARGKWRIRGSELMRFVEGRTDVGPMPELVTEGESR